jgi:V/A-type H+-transporting ATPase subunit B
MVPPQASVNIREYHGVDRIKGPLLVITGAGDAAYGEVAEIMVPNGTTRLGRVLEVSQDRAVIEVFGEGVGLTPSDVRVRFRGHPFQMLVAREMLGRIFDGLGRPRDGLPPPIAKKRVSIGGAPINPVARIYPSNYIQTGISDIDGMNTLVRGQKLPIFSENGLPHDDLAAQIAIQANIAEKGSDFAVIFAGLGISHETAAEFERSLSRSGALNQAALFLNLADDPPVERILTPRLALTLAEFLAFEQDVHVLVILTDMTNYGAALRGISNRREEVPIRKGYPGYLYSDLASIYERCGMVTDASGSVTLLPILTMPNGDITHPIPDLTGYITEGQIVLSRNLDRQEIYPPVDMLASLSRLMKDGIGKGQTRADHQHLANQLYAAYAEAQDTRSLADIIGEEDLPAYNRRHLEFGTQFGQRFLAQGREEERSIEDTLKLGWEVLEVLDKDDLTRVKQHEIKEYYPGEQQEHDADEQ